VDDVCAHVSVCPGFQAFLARAVQDANYLVEAARQTDARGPGFDIEAAMTKVHAAGAASVKDRGMQHDCPNTPAYKQMFH